MDSDTRLISSAFDGLVSANKKDKKASNRRSILSDPRLSQLFQLSSQLEALADSIEVKPLEEDDDGKKVNGGGGGGSKAPLNGSKTPNGNQPLIPITASKREPCFEYERLESGGGGSELQCYDSNPPQQGGQCYDPSAQATARYSAVSDSCMSTSSQGAGSSSAATPSEATRGEGAWPAGEGAWQARCVELEWSLQKFRDQAQNIREMLREKVGPNS